MWLVIHTSFYLLIHIVSLSINHKSVILALCESRDQQETHEMKVVLQATKSSPGMTCARSSLKIQLDLKDRKSDQSMNKDAEILGCCRGNIDEAINV